MFDAGEPGTRDELRTALAAVTAEGVRYLEALPLDLFFAPQGEHWSPAEHVRHLRKSTAPLARALRMPGWILRIRFGRRKGASRGFGELRQIYREALAGGGKAGRFSPSPEAAPADPAVRRGEILTAWQGAMNELMAAAQPWRESALDRTLLPHPLLGHLSVREMLAFTVFHTTHHLTSVARRVEK